MTDDGWYGSTPEERDEERALKEQEARAKSNAWVLDTGLTYQETLDYEERVLNDPSNYRFSSSERGLEILMETVQELEAAQRESYEPLCKALGVTWESVQALRESPFGPIMHVRDVLRGLLKHLPLDIPFEKEGDLNEGPAWWTALIGDDTVFRAAWGLGDIDYCLNFATRTAATDAAIDRLKRYVREQLR